MSVKTIVQFNHFERLLERMLHATDGALDRSARTVRTDAQSLVHVDTGATKASVYVSSPNGSDYGDAIGAAAGMDRHATMLPAEHVGKHEALVGVADAAGIYEEYGTRYVPAHPFLTPAAEGRRDHFTEAVRSALEAVV